MSKKIQLTAAVLSLLLSRGAVAGRRVVSPPNAYRVVVNVAPPGPRPIAFFLHVQVNVANLSDVAQTGKIKLLPGSFAYARCQDPAGGFHSYKGTFLAQADSCGKSSTYSGSGGYHVLNSSPESSFSLPPRGARVLDVGAVMQGAFPFTNGPNGCNGVDSQFSPLVEVSINEDRGAILASITPLFDIIVCTNSNLCGMSLAAECNSQASSVDFVSVPVVLNGGRAF
jgi:hypothetical protein